MSRFAFLLKLTKKGDTQKLIETLQREKININEIDSKSGQGLLHIAIENEDEETFKALTSQPGVDLQLVSKQDETPLDVAVRLNNLWAVNRLLDRNVNFRRKNQSGYTALYGAIRNEAQRQILKKLTHNRLDINEPIQNHGSYLNLAVKVGHSDTFYFILQELAVDYTRRHDDNSNTCLILAVKNNKGDFVMAILKKLTEDQLLTDLDKQFFINHQNNMGNTAIHEAFLRQKQTISDLLEKNGKDLGLDLTLRNKKGQTVEDIRKNRQKQRENQVEMEKRKKEEKVVRKHEKNEEKKRQWEEEERQKIEDARQKKQAQKRIQIESKVKAETDKKKTAWVIAILAIIVMGGMYLAFVNAIEKKKPVTL